MKSAPEIKTPTASLASLPEDRRAALRTLDRAIRKAAPDLEPHLCSGMLGYGRYHYTYASGREGDWAVVSLASQKNYISLYLCVTDEGEYLAEKNKARLVKVSVGRSCIRFKKLEDLDLKVAMELVKKAAALLKKSGGNFAC